MVTLPASYDRFSQIYVIDFEYRSCNDRPVPVCLHVAELRSGQERFFRREELLSFRKAPFDTGHNSLIVAFSANAEMSCLGDLGWPFPENVIDPYVLTIALVNGSKRWPHRKWRPGLLEALGLFGFEESISAEKKHAVRELILNNEHYTAQQWVEIEEYNRSDNVGCAALLIEQASQIDLSLALFWGRFQIAVARQELLGLPVDVPLINRLFENWTALKLDAIRRRRLGHFYDGVHFREQGFAEWVERKGWLAEWPRTRKSGELETQSQTIARMASRFGDPHLKALASLRSLWTDIRMSNVINSVHNDGYARCPLRPFHTVTGRNQPQGRGRSFIPALPAWLHGVLKPPPGFALVELDWKTQEVGIMAALSGDPNMIADYMQGDCHTAFAIRAALFDEDTDEEEQETIRDKQAKPVVLGSNYGMSAYGIRSKTKRSLDWCRHIYRQHRVFYSVFHEWLDNIVTQAQFDMRIESILRWPQHVTDETSARSLMNFPAQAGGADQMRVAAMALTESGFNVCCSVHDSFKLLVPLDTLERDILRVQEIMAEAGRVITGSFPIPAKVKSVVRSPQRLADTWSNKDRGQQQWIEIQARLDSGELGESENGQELRQASEVDH